jgi:hypothetical protein
MGGDTPPLNGEGLGERSFNHVWRQDGVVADYAGGGEV